MARPQQTRPAEVVTIIDDVAPASGPGRRPLWQVLVVDDEADVHEATAFALEGLVVHGSGIAFLHAYSEQEARSILETRDDIAVILLDVVMEAEDSGLRLVRYVRDDLHQRATRIVLHTGQPGYAPEMKVIQDFDINDYKMKSELTRSRLATTMIAAIRSYEQIRAIESGSRALERIVEGATDLFARRGIEHFCEALLLHSCALLGGVTDGLVVATGLPKTGGGTGETLDVVSAVGSYRHLLGQPLADLEQPRVGAAVRDALDRCANHFEARSVTFLVRDSSRASLVVYLETHAALAELDRRLLGVFCANASVAFENARLFERLRTHAYTDQLTALANRTRFVNLIDERIVAGRESWVVGILDIDHFSDTNDALGHAFGDLLLKGVAARLAKSLGPDVTLARVAGDAFGMLGPAGELDPGPLLAVFARPFKVGAHSLQVSASLGLVRLRETRGSGLDAIKDASIGLSRAKRRKQGSYCYFTHDMEAETKERLRLASGLRRSLRKQQLLLHYQPQVELATGRVVGAEALLRWRGSDGKFVPPDRFIPVAESSGLIGPVGSWALRTAARQLQHWAGRWPGEFRLAVNVSIDQFRMPDFSDQVRAVIDEFGIDPQRLELEITESIAMDEMKIVLDALADLKRIGVSIAIDDFGTGYSSLGYLQKLDVDRLKIDRSFVHGLNAHLGDDASDAARAPFSSIAEMIVRLGHNLNLQVVAEGVETEEQARLLHRFGCDRAQGYLYSRPIAAEAFEQWLDARGTA